MYLQVRAESPVEHIAQGKRSGTLGLRVLEQSRPERAKALLSALDLDRKQYIITLTDRTDSTDFFVTCFGATEMTDLTDFVSIACSLRYWPVACG